METGYDYYIIEKRFVGVRERMLLEWKDEDLD
jgi:hypothetical protein